MMINVEQISGELKVIDEAASKHSLRLESENGEILNTMGKAQETFGDQPSGQMLVTSLSYVINNIMKANSALYLLKSDIREFIQQIQK